jgi:PAS domain-containing protein
MTLETKFNRGVISLFLIAAIISTVLLVYFQQQQIEMTAGKISVFLESIAENNTKALANELFENRYRAIQLRLESIVNIEGIDHAAVFDTHAESIVDTDRNSNNLTLEEQALPSSAEHRIENSNLVFITPIQAYGETFGYLYLQYPLSDLKREEAHNVLLFALSIFLFMLITLILLKTFIRKSIVLPLNNLIAVMGDVKTGSFGRQIEVTGSDEIRELSQTFNLMSGKISTGYVKIRKTRLFIEQIIDTIDSILIAVERDNRISAWNDAAVQYTGTEKDEAVGQDLFVVFPHLEAYKKQIIHAIHLGKDAFVHRQSLEGVFYNVFIYPLPDKDSS